MLLAAFFLNSTLLALSIVNYLSIRRPQQSRKIKSSVAILLPVRNEEENITRILQELQAQEGVDRLRIIVIDDESSDRTRELALKAARGDTVVIDARPPAPGWIGKVNALDCGLESLAVELPDYIVSIDADVSFEPAAISRAIATIEDTNLDFISPYPRQIALTWGERLIQPLLQWSWMSTLFIRGAEIFPHQSTVVCNGQFLVMRTSSLISSGGFSSVSGAVLDDIELGRSFVRAGFRGAVINGAQIASTRMYANFKEIRGGYGKSLHRAFGGIVGSLVAASFFLFTAIIPALLALTGDIFAIAALIAIISTRVVSAEISESRIRDSFLHPVSALLFLYLLYFSWAHRSEAQWKGRTI
jgi:glycosyltransferase involved in cell wall biosynthesis